MSPRLRRALPRLVYTVAALALGAIVVSAYPLLRAPPAWQPPRLDERPRAQPSSPASGLTLDQLAVIWQRDLRQAVVDMPAPPPGEPPQLAIRLEATAIEAAQRYGVFRLENSSLVLRPVGALIDGFELVRIDPGRAVLRAGEREYTLTVPWYDRIAGRAGE